MGSPVACTTGVNGITAGGILLRSVKRIEDGNIISGPSLLVDEILHRFSADSISQLVSTLWNADLSAFDFGPDGKREGPTLRIVRIPSIHPRANAEIHTSPRIGLDLSNPEATAATDDPRVQFVGRLYRFFRWPAALRSNGRLQTFVGLLLETSSEKHLYPARIAAIGGFQVKVVDTYLKFYKKGLLSSDVAPFIGTKGKGTSTSPRMYLSLIGTLVHLGILAR